MTDKSELIQWLINRYGYKKYLEIGSAKKHNFNKINCEFKLGVDCDESVKDITDWFGTSDEFFLQNKEKWDIIFIDGCHLWEYAYRDMINALNVLSENGTIICHDMHPRNEWTCRRDIGDAWRWSEWYGDAYKGLLKLRKERDDIWVHVLEGFDCGTTIIRKTKSNPYLKSTIPDWDVSVETYLQHMKDWVGAMTIEEYLQRCSETIICAMAKQEGKYIENWIQWHLERGFDRIYIYDNNDENGETYDLNKYPVEIRKIRGLKGQQIQQYESFYHEGLFEWVAYIDIDEFIDLKDNYKNIKDFLKLKEDATGYIFQWECYKANPKNDIIDKPIWEYCTEKLEDNIRKDSRYENMNGWYKTISKSGLNLEMNEHTTWGENHKVYDCLGNEVSSLSFKYRDHSKDTVILRHYILKNISEFYYNKYLRGHAGLDLAAVDGYTFWNWNQNLNYYTDIQGILSEEEQKFLRSRGYKPNYIFRPMMDVILHVGGSGMNWYEARKSEILYDCVFHTADCRVEIVVDTNGGYNDAVRNETEDRLAFMSFTWYHSAMASCWWPPLLQKSQSYDQPELVLVLGWDIENCDQNFSDQEKLDILNNTLNCMFNEEWKNRMHKVIEHPEIMIVPNAAIERDPECGGWKDLVDEFCNDYGVENKGIRIKNNTFLTSRSQQEKIINAQNDFYNKHDWNITKDIINLHKNGQSSLYDAWQYCYPCIIDQIEMI